jgi:hypothetical protein
MGLAVRRLYDVMIQPLSACQCAKRANICVDAVANIVGKACSTSYGSRGWDGMGWDGHTWTRSDLARDRTVPLTSAALSASSAESAMILIRDRHSQRPAPPCSPARLNTGSRARRISRYERSNDFSDMGCVV